MGERGGGRPCGGRGGGEYAGGGGGRPCEGADELTQSVASLRCLTEVKVKLRERLNAEQVA